jgi:hypothetical protein
MGSDDHASFSHSSDLGNFGSSASGRTKGAIAGSCSELHLSRLPFRALVAVGHGCALACVSIGYKAIENKIRRSDGARLLKQINLVEISFCPRPTNPLAEVETVKSLFADPNEPILTLESLADEMQSLAHRVRRG